MRLLPISVLALGLLAACDGDSTGPDGDRSGSLRFDYAGSGYGGTFSASGRLDLNGSGNPEFGSFAFAVRDESGRSDAVVITAFDPAQQPRGDAMVLIIEPATGTGDFSLDFDCDPGTGDDCAFGLFVPDVDIRNADLETQPQGAVFFFDTGTLSVTRLGSESVEGSFSGTGVFVDLETGDESGLVRVTDGRFEVPILRESEIGALASHTSAAPALSRRLAPRTR
jgi:hypothetical protein